MRLIGWTVAVFFVLALLVAFQFSLQTHDVKSEGRFVSSHSDVACGDCHALVAGSDGSSTAATPQREQCTACHQPDTRNATGVPLNFHLGKDKTCAECHSYHHTEIISSGQHRFTVCFENSHQRGQCFSCHGPSEDFSRLSPAHRAAARVFHSDVGLIGQLSPSEACLCCHSETATVGLPDLDEHRRRAPRFVAHGSHPTGVKVVAGHGRPGNCIVSKINPRLQLINGRIECQTCHSLSGGRARALAVESRNELCRGCHQVD